MSNVASAHSLKLAEASCIKPAKSTKHGVSCLACKVHVRKHPLYSYSIFKALPCGQCAAMAIKNELCILTALSHVTSGQSVHRLIWKSLVLDKVYGSIQKYPEPLEVGYL